MNILIVGSGGREAAILKKLHNESLLDPTIKLYCIGSNNNPDMSSKTEESLFYSDSIDSILFEKIVSFSIKKNINMVIIGSENYIEGGLVDLLESHNIHCIAPKQELAQIETNKAFTRKLIEKSSNLSRYNPKYKLFTSLESHTHILEYIQFCEYLGFNYVIKPTGLCSGKGVLVSGEHFNTHLEGLKCAISILDGSNNVIIEEKITGKEYSLMSYTDGTHFSHMPIVQDFKRELNDNKGANTGSMGCISYSNHSVPFLMDDEIKKSQLINETIIKELQTLIGDTYKGIIYGSFIKCNYTGKLKIIEYNCRYGDPECIPVLELLETRLIDIYMSIINNTLHNINVSYLHNKYDSSNSKIASVVEISTNNVLKTV